MLFVDADDTVNFISIAVAFEIRNEIFGLEGPPSEIMGIVDEPFAPEIEGYLASEHKRIVPELFISQDAQYVLGRFIGKEQFIWLFRGHMSKTSYEVDGDSVTIESEDSLGELSIEPLSIKNLSFYFNKEEMKKVLEHATSFATASYNAALAALELPNIEKVYYFVRSWNDPHGLYKRASTLPELYQGRAKEKLVLVNDWYHLAMYRSQYAKSQEAATSEHDTSTQE